MFKRLESRTQRVNIAAEHDIYFDSRGGDIQIISLNDIELTANDLIAFNTRRLEIKHLKKSHVLNVDSDNAIKSYQVSDDLQT